MADVDGDSRRSLDVGDLVHLSVQVYGPSGERVDAEWADPLRSQTVLLGSDSHRYLETQLIGTSVGDTGQAELRPDGSLAAVTRAADVLSSSVAAALKDADIDSAWALLRADPDVLSDDVHFDPTDLRELQEQVHSSLEDRALVVYKTTDAYRWSDTEQATDDEQTMEHTLAFESRADLLLFLPTPLLFGVFLGTLAVDFFVSDPGNVPAETFQAVTLGVAALALIIFYTRYRAQ